jgi:hypothetical protein
MTNSGPNGSQLNRALEQWAFEHFLGIKEVEPEQLLLGDEALAAYAGTYETIAATVTIRAVAGRLEAAVAMKPEMAAALREQGEAVPEEQPPIPFALLAGDGDTYVVSDGPAKGMKGYFSRGADGNIDGVHVGGRLATRISDLVDA